LNLRPPGYETSVARLGDVRWGKLAWFMVAEVSSGYVRRAKVQAKVPGVCRFPIAKVAVAVAERGGMSEM
jgi:hypothetical protein